MENQMVFQRIEKKYLLTPQRYRALMHALTACMVQDQYGLHTITSLYLDTEDYKLIRTSVQKPIFKEKMRLRWYGIPKPDDDIFLELKRKYHGVVYKRRIAISYVQTADAGGRRCVVDTGADCQRDGLVFEALSTAAQAAAGL